MAGAPVRVSVVVHRRRAVAVEDLADGRQLLQLADGGAQLLDALVLATGHSDVDPTPAEQRTRDFAARGGLC